MQLIKVLIASLIAAPAMAHHEGAATSSIDTMVIALVCAAILLALAVSIKVLPQSQKAMAKIKSSESKK